MLDKFLYDFSDEGGAERINLSIVIATLEDESLEVEHDDAYDTISLIDDSYIMDLPILVNALQNPDSNSFALWYALQAIPKVLQLDADAGSQQIAIELLEKVQTQVTVSLLSNLTHIVKDLHAFVNIRFESLVLLTKLVGLRGAVEELFRQH